MARRIPGERPLRKAYLVMPVGQGGCSKAAVLHPDMDFKVGELVQYSDLGDGTYRVFKIRDKAHMRMR